MLQMIAMIAILLMGGVGECFGAHEIEQSSSQASLTAYVTAGSMVAGGIIGCACGDYIRNTLLQGRMEAHRYAYRSRIYKEACDRANSKLAVIRSKCNYLRHRCNEAKSAALALQSNIDNLFQANSRTISTEAGRSYDAVVAECDKLVHRVTPKAFARDCREFLQLRKRYAQHNGAHGQKKSEMDGVVEDAKGVIRDIPQQWSAFTDALQCSTYDVSRSRAEELKSSVTTLRDCYHKAIPCMPHKLRELHRCKVDNQYQRFIQNVDHLLWHKKRRSTMTACVNDVHDNIQRIDNTCGAMDVEHVRPHVSASTPRAMTWFERLLPHGLAICGALAGCGIAALFGYA